MWKVGHLVPSFNSSITEFLICSCPLWNGSNIETQVLNRYSRNCKNLILVATTCDSRDEASTNRNYAFTKCDRMWAFIVNEVKSWRSHMSVWKLLTHLIQYCVTHCNTKRFVLIVWLYLHSLIWTMNRPLSSGVAWFP